MWPSAISNGAAGGGEGEGGEGVGDGGDGGGGGGGGGLKLTRKVVHPADLWHEADLCQSPAKQPLSAVLNPMYVTLTAGRAAHAAAVHWSAVVMAAELRLVSPVEQRWPLKLVTSHLPPGDGGAGGPGGDGGVGGVGGDGGPGGAGGGPGGGAGPLVPPQLLSARASLDMKGSMGWPPQSAATSPIGTCEHAGIRAGK